MNIAFSTQDQKKVGLNKRSLTKNNMNEDALWLATILSNVPPLNENYLYLKHAKTGFALLELIDGNKKNRRNIEKHIKKAFLRFFDSIKQEEDMDAGLYEKLLENIKFIEVPRKYQKMILELQIDKEDFMNDFLNSSFPRNYYLPILSLNFLNEYKNFNIKTDSGKTPYENLKGFLKKFQGNYKRKEVKFKENLNALERPHFDYVTNIDSQELIQSEDSKLPLRIDRSQTFLKEPIERNIKKFQKLKQQFDKVIISSKGNLEDPMIKEKIQILIKKLNKLVSYYQSPYSGEYKNLRIPEKIPERSAFEFLITLDTGSNLVTRRIVVPADMNFKDFDRLISHLFRWAGFPYHLSEFIFPLKNSPEGKEASELLIWMEEDYPNNKFLWPADITYRDYMNPFDGVPKSNIKDKKLNDYFPKFKTAQYRYDFGDNWYHTIELVNIYDLENFNKKLPYLLDSVGVAPLDDIGGPKGFNDYFSLNFNSFDPEKFLDLGMDWYVNEFSNILQAPCSLAPLFERDSEEDINIIYLDKEK